MYRNGKGPLQPVLAFEPFMKWGLDYMGLIKPPTHYTWKPIYYNYYRLHHKVGGSKGVTK
jgi:hypothetical protein